MRKVSFLMTCALAILCLLAPVVSQAQEASGKLPAPEAPGVTVALFSTPAPAAGEAGVCPAALPAIAQPLHSARQVATCSSYACGGSVPIDCHKLCGDFAFCNKPPGYSVGHCTFQ